MEALKAYIVPRGLFMALYTERASHSLTTRHGGLHCEVAQIEMTFHKLRIAHGTASTPQAKGRIERFFQDRFIKKMRLKGITDYKSANQFREEEFLPYYNHHYTLPVESVRRSFPKAQTLNLFSPSSIHGRLKRTIP